jgi:hypothetical protein
MSAPSGCSPQSYGGVSYSFIGFFLYWKTSGHLLRLAWVPCLGFDSLFVRNLKFGLLASPSPQAPTPSRGLAEGLARLVIILAQAFSLKKWRG